MVVVRQTAAGEEQIRAGIERLVALAFDIHRSTGASRTVPEAVGVQPDFDAREQELLAGLVDPAHGTARRDQARPIALAAIAGGADGLLLEVHNDPEKALSDGAQFLYFDPFENLMAQARLIPLVVGRQVA